MIEYALLASKPSVISSDFVNMLVNFWDDIFFWIAVGWNYLPFWAIVGVITAFALLIYWLFSRK